MFVLNTWLRNGTRELTESSARYQELVEHTPDVVIARFDRDVRYLFINSLSANSAR